MNRIIPTVLTFLLFVPVAACQDPSENLFALDLSADVTTKEVDVGGAVDFTIVFRDMSKDSTGGISPQPGVPNVSPRQHQVQFSYTLNTNETNGWYVLKPGTFYSRGGDEREFRVTVGASLLVQSVFMPLTITATTMVSGRAYTASINLTVFTLGASSFNAQAEDLGGEIKPGTIVDVPIRITNGGLQPRGFDIEVVENTCGLLTATSSNNLVGPKETKIYTVSVRTPGEQLWYFSEICSLTIKVSPASSPLSARVVTVPIIVNGGYVNPQWIIWFVEIAIVLLILFWIIARRKARIEEEILGKPQKPWTIPIEVLYLKALREKDERAWYVVRHHLMEEEYRSALLWYHSYKSATKGSRKKESTVLRQEKLYKRWRKQWKRVIAKPIKEADRFEAKLQRKLDRQARKGYRKQTGKYDAVRAKMEKSYAGQVERALAAWEKDVRKAQKKGQALPPRPTVPEPDYPAEPDEQGIALADHKWATKAERFRAKMVRKQGDLEVKFEKADLRYLRKLRRKIGRLARKLDDPTFIDEHPLLKADGA